MGLAIINSLPLYGMALGLKDCLVRSRAFKLDYISRTSRTSQLVTLGEVMIGGERVKIRSGIHGKDERNPV